MRASFVALFALPILAAATAELDARQSGSCNTGSVTCCNQLLQSTTQNLALISSLFGGISLPNIGANIGLTCTPISVLGAGGNSCSTQPVCCDQNNFGGLLNLGCSPVNLNL